MKIVPVILAGGKGERFWPRSRARVPKQFLPLMGTTAMLAQTVERLNGHSFFDTSEVWVSTHAEYEEQVQGLLGHIKDLHIIAEPVARNTGPGIGLVAIHLRQTYGDVVMCVLPADHTISDKNAFHLVLEQAICLAIEGQIVTLGIVPTRPESGYGYIERGHFKAPAFEVKRFVEKPSYEVAEAYVASGRFLWNSGMFIFKTSTILDQIKEHLPDLYAGLMQIEHHIGLGDYESVLYEVFSSMKGISIDHGVMEKTSKIVVFPADIGWDDVGSWLAMSRLGYTDHDTNYLRGNVLVKNSHGNIVDSIGKRLVVLSGVSDLVIVDCDDVLMVCHKDKIPDIRTLVAEVKIRKGKLLGNSGFALTSTGSCESVFCVQIEVTQNDLLRQLSHE